MRRCEVCRECAVSSTGALAEALRALMDAVPRVLRTTLPDGYFHVTSRGVNGCSIFRDDDDRRSFLAHMRTCVERYRWTLYALCLMTTHYHLVLHSTQPDLSRGLQRLQGGYAQAFNERHGRFGHLFADRFTARAIEGERYLHTACSYVVENPVRAGLCDSIEEWPWSHSRHHPRAAYPSSTPGSGTGLARHVPADLDLVDGRRSQASYPHALFLGNLRELEPLL
jgi:REP element-mobilizing transposase RayT